MKKITTTVITACEVDEIFEVSGEVYEKFFKMAQHLEYDDDIHQEAYDFLSENNITKKITATRKLDSDTYFNLIN